MAVMTTSYLWTNPGGGGYQTTTTTAPTAAQAFYLNQLQALINGADADTTCTITTNWALTAAEQANLYPVISYIENNDSTGTVATVLKFTIATNTIAVTKANTVAGSQGTWLVTLSRATIIR